MKRPTTRKTTVSARIRRAWEKNKIGKSFVVRTQTERVTAYVIAKQLGIRASSLRLPNGTYEFRKLRRAAAA